MSNTLSKPTPIICLACLSFFLACLPVCEGLLAIDPGWGPYHPRNGLTVRGHSRRRIPIRGLLQTVWAGYVHGTISRPPRSNCTSTRTVLLRTSPSGGHHPTYFSSTCTIIPHIFYTAYKLMFRPRLRRRRPGPPLFGSFFSSAR